MQDQGKRLLIAVAAALGLMLVWNLVFPPKEDKPDPSKGSDGSGSAAAVVSTAPAVIDFGAAPSSAPAESARGAEQFLDVSYPEFTAKFSNYGGTLVSWKLVDPRYANDATKGELLPDHAKFPDAGAFDVNFTRDSTLHLPLRAEWKGERVSGNQVKYTLSTPDFDVEKLYTIDPSNYIVRLNLKVATKVAAGKEANQTLAVLARAFQDPKLADKGSYGQSLPRSWHTSSLQDGKVHTTNQVELIKDRATGMVRHEKGIQWAGFEHPYLFVAIAPKPLAANDTFEKWALSDEQGLMASEILFGRQTIKPGDAAIAREMVAYLGPKNYKDLDRADGVAGFETGFKATIDLGWFAFIGRPLLWLLLKFQSVVVNWGFAIVLLTFLVKGATLYWTTKSTRSMKLMAALGPQMKELQEKYKDDRQRLQVETMALYKQHSVNPIAGCLPILLQMPIWLALYRMLSTAGELYQQPFVGGWIDDLTAPDPTHVLPAVLVVTMFVQARLTPATSDSTQQKIMQYGMPLMFGVMSFFFPAGLTLYIFTNTLLSAVHSIYMNKYDRKSLEIAEMMKANKEKAEAAKVEAENAKKKAAEKAEVKAAKAKSSTKADKAADKSDDKSEAKSDDKPASDGAKKKKAR